MGPCGSNEVSRHQQMIQEVLSPNIISNIIKPSVAGVRSIKFALIAIVLHVDVMLECHVLKGLQRVLVPNHVNVKEQRIVSQHADKLHAKDLKTSW